jgi:hypothetical protein
MGFGAQGWACIDAAVNSFEVMELTSGLTTHLHAGPIV